MKKILLHYILLAVLIGIVFVLFVSCSNTLQDETGIVTITIEVEPMIIGVDRERPEETYYIYMDDDYKGVITVSGVLTLEDVSTGIHTFEASNHMVVGISSDRQSIIDTKSDLTGKVAVFCNGSIEYKVTTGINYVTIPVSCYLDGVMNSR